MMQSPRSPRTSPFQGLPPELTHTILPHLSGRDLASLSAVSRQTRQHVGPWHQHFAQHLNQLASRLVRAMSAGNVTALQTTLSQVLADRGYRTALGRFHRRPQALGQAPAHLQQAYRSVRQAVAQAGQRLH